MDLAVYVHIPFCQQKCSYCDFTSFPPGGYPVHEYLDAVLAEAQTVQRLAQGAIRARTVYLGGGTPSLIPPQSLVSFLGHLAQCLPLLPQAEVTLEANPGTLSQEALDLLREGGYNRISMGAQSLQSQGLKVLGRIHGVQQIGQAVDWARQAGFAEINLDMIIGWPGQQPEGWEEDLQQLVSWNLPHLSLYGLQVEEGTVLDRQISQGLLDPVGEETELELMEQARRVLEQGGYQRYEISNWAWPGHESKHNLVYWRNEHYLGLGVAAHSHLPGLRVANPGSLAEYSQKGQVPTVDHPLLREWGAQLSWVEAEVITPRQEMSETAFLGLRLAEGIDETRFLRRYGLEFMEVFGEALAPWREMGLVKREHGRVWLTQRGMDLSNPIFASLLPPGPLDKS